MKRKLYLLTILCLLASKVLAQAGLQVDKVFGQEYRKQKNVVEVRIEGQKVEPYGLTVFRSLTLKADSVEVRHLVGLVRQDARRAVDKEEGTIGGKLCYGFYRFSLPVERRSKGRKSAPYRYLFFRRTVPHGARKPEVTLVYMEGFVSIRQLKQMFK